MRRIQRIAALAALPVLLLAACTTPTPTPQTETVTITFAFTLFLLISLTAATTLPHLTFGISLSAIAYTTTHHNNLFGHLIP